MLLKTVDDPMGKSGWNHESNYAIANISWSIENPDERVPIMAFRYYKHKDYPNRLSYISILLDDHWERKYTINEPLVTAGYFDYGKNKVGKVGENWNYRYLRFYGYLSKDHDLKADGTPFQFEANMIPPAILGKFDKFFTKGEVFAIPLTSVKTPNDVALQITDKIISLLKN